MKLSAHIRSQELDAGSHTLCGRTPRAPRWSEVEPASLDDALRVANVSCNSCRKALGTLVEGIEAQHDAAYDFIEREAAK